MHISSFVINLNKPQNFSSQQAVIRVKRFFTAKKAGHAGTLDPIATGVLIVCLNEATKITRFLSDLDKEYVVRLKLGERTDTFDLTGKIIEKKKCPQLDKVDILEILNNFVGRVNQIPPMHSAIKQGGIPLYKLARIGMNVKRPERTVNIYSLELLCFEMPYIELKIVCSKGTYVRTLCDDIGKVLRTGAHMVSLKRTRIGTFRLKHASTIEDLTEKKDTCHTVDSALSHLDEIVLNEDSFQKAKHGMPITFASDKRSKGQYVRLKDPHHNLFGIGLIEPDRIKIVRLFNISL